MSKTILALTAAAFVGVASFAAAEPFNTNGNYFSQTRTVQSSSLFDISFVTASGAGTVGIYDYSGGNQGKLLGEVRVNAGANADLRINLGVPPQNDVIAVLTVGGEVTAIQEYDVTTR